MEKAALKTSTTRSSEKCSLHGCYISKMIMVGAKEIWTKCPECAKDIDIKEAEKESKPSWVSKRQTGRTFDNYNIVCGDQGFIVERVTKYANNFKKVLELGSCMCFVGKPGTGKTHLATAVGVEVWNNGFSVSYKRLYDLMVEIKETYSNAVQLTETEIIRRLVEFDLLILDEVGLKTMTETETTLTYQILDKRYEEIKPTIIISNLSEEELSENLGARTVDRLYENHGAVFIFDWESVRRK